jgi:hypothetical protein
MPSRFPSAEDEEPDEKEEPASKGQDEQGPEGVVVAIKEHMTTLFFYVVAGCLLYVGFRVAFDKERIDSDRGMTALYLIAAAAGVILAREFIYILPRIKSAKAPGVELQLADVQKKLKTDPVLRKKLGVEIRVANEIADLRAAEEAGRRGKSAKQYEKEETV